LLEQNQRSQVFRMIDDLVKTLDIDGIGSTFVILWLVFGVLAVVGGIIYVPQKRKQERITELENAWPDVLADLAEELRAGMGVESALDAIANSRKDQMGLRLRDAVNDMRDHGFGKAMTNFAKNSESPMISRIVSILNVALASSGSIATTLEKISDEFWDIYMLKKERLVKTQSSANFILWGGAILCPIMLGAIVAIFGGDIAMLSFDMSDLNSALFFYMIILGACSLWMEAVILQKTKTAIWRTPIFVFYAITALLLALQIKLG